MIVKKAIAGIVHLFVFCSFFSFPIAEAAPRKGKPLPQEKITSSIVKRNASKSVSPLGVSGEVIASEAVQNRELSIQIKELKTKVKGLKNQVKSSKLQLKKMENKIDQILGMILSQVDGADGQDLEPDEADLESQDTRHCSMYM